MCLICTCTHYLCCPLCFGRSSLNICKCTSLTALKSVIKALLCSEACSHCENGQRGKCWTLPLLIASSLTHRICSPWGKGCLSFWSVYIQCLSVHGPFHTWYTCNTNWRWNCIKHWLVSFVWLSKIWEFPTAACSCALGKSNSANSGSAVEESDPVRKFQKNLEACCLHQLHAKYTCYSGAQWKNLSWRQKTSLSDPTLGCAACDCSIPRVDLVSCIWVLGTGRVTRHHCFYYQSSGITLLEPSSGGLLATPKIPLTIGKSKECRYSFDWD